VGIFLCLKAPALGFWGMGLSLGLLRLVALPPNPSPFFKIATPVAAMLYSNEIVGPKSVTLLFLGGRYSLGKSPNGECYAFGRSLLS